jgi:hypothetical protein
VAVALAVLAPACEPTGADASGPQPGDGTTSATAGASCFGIHRAFPSAPSGVYWLLTPAMQRPAPFRCDMATDGGGWVLVARGREGWDFLPTGQGTAAQVRSQVSGPAAFAPAALDSATIGGLINGAAPSALSDGIRVERALDTGGTRWQQLRIYPRFTSWTWAWPSGQLLNKAVLDGKTYLGSNTKDTYEPFVYGQTRNDLARKQGTARMFTWAWSKNDDLAGFSYGAGGPRGSTDPSSNLWQRSSTTYALPFTRIWLRPRLANTLAFPTIPAGGYPAQPEPANLKNRSERAGWGVVGLDHTNEANVEPWNTNVLAVRTTPTRVFVAGRFTGVQQGPTGTPIAQPSLAAFDLDGNWIDTFRPKIAGRVWDVLPTTDGKLIVAGDFTSVNGAPDTSGLAALDPVTGAVIPGWRASTSRSVPGSWRVRTIEQQGDWIYAAGLFDRVAAGPVGPTPSAPVAVANAMSVRLSDGSLGTWRPTTNGQVVRIAISQGKTRILMAGYFSAVDGDANHGYFAITALATGAVIPNIGPWVPSGGSVEKYQQAVADLGSRVVVGGSEHDTQLWTASRSKLLDAAVTRDGGDTQAIEVVGTKTYIACHCGDRIYLGTNDYWNPQGFRAVEPINLVARFDTATWTYDTSWYPASLKGAYGEGVWTIDQDVRGCLWVGGDLVRGAYSGDPATDWLGGFARFCPLDPNPPSAPGALVLTSTGTSRKLTWGPSVDPEGGAVSYDVVRNDRVIASVSGLTYTDPSAPAGTRYTVRAVDARGNRSASPAPATA